MPYSFGFDIGSESVGWAVVELDSEGNPVSVVNMGVRAFDAVANEAEEANTPAKERRLARSQRRRLRNKRKRKKKFISLAVEYGLLGSKNEALHVLEQGKSQESPWKLRVKGLDELLSREEWFRVLYHFLNQRGFKLRFREDKDETGELKKAASALSKIWKEKGYRSIAEFFEKDPEWFEKYGDRRRNKEGDYTFTIYRDDLITEIKLLFDSQRKLGNPYTDYVFEEKYLEIFDEEPKILEGEELLKLVGECTLEKGEKRAPRDCLTSQLFVAYQTLSNVRVVDFDTGEEFKLGESEIQKLIELGFEKKSVKRSHVLKICGIENGDVINFREKKELFKFEAYHKVKDALKDVADSNFLQKLRNSEYFDELAKILTYYKTEKTLVEKLREFGLPEDYIASLKHLQFKGHLRLSLKAMKNLIPYLKEGKTYPEALKEAGYSDKKLTRKTVVDKIPAFTSPDFEPELRWKVSSITNPNVIRALTQARKVFNALVKEYGVPQRVVVEFAREFAIPRSLKKKIANEQKEREKERKGAKEEIEKILENNGIKNIKINNKMIDKFILYQQQDGKSAYSLKPIDLQRMLIDETYTEIDHIIPRSLTFDNSMSNKVLVLSDDNRNKGDELAAVFIKRHFGEEHYQRFKNEFVNGILFSKMKNNSHRAKELKKKRENLKKEELTEEEKMMGTDVPEAKNRHLHIASYTATLFREIVETYFPNTKVLTPSGGLVAQLRNICGLSKLKNRGISDKHHAVDAAICAVVDFKTIKRLSEYYKYIELHRRRLATPKDYETGFEPFPGFRNQILELYDKIIVSRLPRKRATGKGHKDTIYSISHLSGIKLPEKGRISLPKGAMPIKRVRLDQLTPSEIKEILKEPSPILVDEKSNWKLYKMIRERLLKTAPKNAKEEKDWAQRAFGTDEGKIFMPTKDGGKGPEVKKISIYKNIRSGVFVRGGLAENANIVRLDFYRRMETNGKYRYYVAPVYTSDIACGIRPDRLAVKNKDESEWIKVDESFEFLFYLFPGEYIKIQKTPNDEPEIIYMVSFDRNGVRVLGNKHDRSNRSDSGSVTPIDFAITKAYKVEKVFVDVLGRCFPIKKEKQIY